MLQIQNFTLIQKKDHRTLIDGLSFHVNDGEKVAVVGEEGNGKSTLLKWIADPAQIEPYADAFGERTVTGLCGYLPQELTATERETPVAAWMEQACALSACTPREVARAAQQLHIPMELFWEDRPLSTLSGGERIKVQLAALELRGCDTLLLDEPSNDLDLETLDWLERFLLHTDKTVLYISHDETLLERTAEAVLHIELVRRKTIPRATFRHKPYRQYFEERARAMEHQAQTATFEQKAFREKKERYLAIYNAVNHAQAANTRQDPQTGRLLKKKMHTVQSLGRRLEKEQQNLTEQPEAEWAILPKVEEGVSVPNGKTVLDFHLDALCMDGRVLAENISLRVNGAAHVYLIGRNGCGKSTLLKRIADELLPRRDLRTGYMPQMYDELLTPDQTPISFLAPTGEKSEVTKARLYLGSMKYTTDEMEHSVRELSGGQRAKLFLVKLILERCNVLLLDEPTRNFSPLSAPAVRELLASFPGAVIAVSHDRKLLAQAATQVYRLTERGLTGEDRLPGEQKPREKKDFF